MPAVEYEFSVGGRKVRGNRIGIGEDSGGADTEATLRRYTVGAAVTVYYDPANPKNCVLERGVPEGVGKGLAIIVGFVIAFVGVVYWLATGAPRLVEHHYPQRQRSRRDHCRQHGRADAAVLRRELAAVAPAPPIGRWSRGTVLSSGNGEDRKALGWAAGRSPTRPRSSTLTA